MNPALKMLMTAAAVCTVLCTAAAQQVEKPQYGAWGIDRTAMDPKIKPGDDFNRYASGAWLARTEIPADKPMASLRYAMTDRTESRLHEIMEQAAARASAQPSTLQGKIGAFYKSFQDDARIEKLAAGPIAPELEAIRAARDRADLAELMGRNSSDFFATIFNLSIDVDLKNVSRYAVYANQSGLGLPDRDYYLQSSFAAQKAAYQDYVAKLLGLMRWPDAQAKGAAVVAFEARIAQASWSKSEQREIEKIYNPMATAQLASFTPGFAWQRFLHGAGLDATDRVIVAEKSAFPRIVAIFASTPVEVLQAWQAFTVADNAAYYLSQPFSTARFQFRDKILSGQSEDAVRWKRAVRAVGGGDCSGDRVDCFGNMGFGVGQLYTARYFPPAAKAKIEALVVNLKAAMRAPRAA